MRTKTPYHCDCCDYGTDHKVKFQRHLATKKHNIATYGIKCCGLIYFDKHKWVNHKKSYKHITRSKEEAQKTDTGSQKNQDRNDLSGQLEMSRKTKVRTLKLTPKNRTLTLTPRSVETSA